jgi:predicted RNase H-like HicB family nuclease
VWFPFIKNLLLELSVAQYDRQVLRLTILFMHTKADNKSADITPVQSPASPSALSKMTMVYWKSRKFWLGKLLEHPEIMTQGRTLDELERNIREAYMLMALDEVPKGCQIRGVAMV